MAITPKIKGVTNKMACKFYKDQKGICTATGEPCPLTRATESKIDACEVQTFSRRVSQMRTRSIRRLIDKFKPQAA